MTRWTRSIGVLVATLFVLWVPARAQQPVDVTAYTTVTTTATGTQNDFAPGLSWRTYLRCNNASLLTITGITPGFDGQEILIVADNAEVDLSSQDTGSVAANRIVTMLSVAAGTKLPLKGSGFGVARLVYDAAASRWHERAHDQGGAIDYSTTSTITGWTSFTTKRLYYEVIGSRVFIDYDLEGTSNATTTSFTIPYTPSDVTLNLPVYAQDSGGTFAFGVAIQSAATVNLAPTAAGNMSGWTNSGTKVVIGHFSYQTN